MTSHITSDQNPPSSLRSSTKSPRPILTDEVLTDEAFTSKAFSTQDQIYAFPPNRDTLGGTAYLIVRNQGNILVDCPAWDEANREFLIQQGGVQVLVLTHRGGMGKTEAIQQFFNCPIVVQEQEAYLLPGLTLQLFQNAYDLGEGATLFWTAGHSPGSACLYWSSYGGILFSGRHLLPNAQGNPAPLRTAKTFHWPRQLRNVQLFLDRYTPQTLTYLCPGANTGFLRGKRVIDRAYDRLAQLDLKALLQTKPLL